MLGLILIFALVWACLAVLLLVGTAWLQGYLYTEPVSGVLWRGPAAATVIVLFLAFWCFLDSRDPPGRFRTYDFRAQDVKEVKELWGVTAGKRTHYKLEKDAAGRDEFRDDSHRKMPSRLDAIIVKENGEEVKFEPERDAQGKLKDTPGQNLRYEDPEGRVMTEGSIGQITTFRLGRLLANLFLNFFLLLVWFGCLWLLLRFQWSHALGFAAVAWLVLEILVMPGLLDRVERQATQPAYPSTGETAS